MATEILSNDSLRPRLAELTTQIEALKQAPVLLAELRQLVDQLLTEREHLRQQLEHLQIERDRLQAERSRLLHAWADLAISEEELDRASKETGACSLTEIWERLGVK